MIPTFLSNRGQQMERYAMAGSLVFLLSHIQYRLLYAMLAGSPVRAGAAWVIHFIIATIWSHATHRGFTFRHEPQLPYLHSLFRTFGMYAFVLGITTAIMVLLCDVCWVHPIIGWALVSMISAVCNFLTMSYWTICSPVKELSHESNRYHADRPHQE